MSDPSSQPTQPLTDAELANLREMYCGPYDEDFKRVLAEVDRLRAQSAAIKAVADRMAPHAENMCRIGELEIGVPLRAAVRDIRSALGLDQDGNGNA